jgi:hypothetical protein
VRDVFPQELVELAREIIETNMDNFWGIHSLESEEHEGRQEDFQYCVGRLIIHISAAHRQALLDNEETHVILGNTDRAFLAAAAKLAKGYSAAIHAAAESIGIRVGLLDEQEILTQVPYSKGQSKHMDTWGSVWNAITPILPHRNPPMTQLVHYPNGHQPYPMNIGPDSKIPRDWATLEYLDLKWDVGDILFIRSNYIHNGPPNPSPRARHILFATETSSHYEFTDTEVIVNSVFNQRRVEGD